MKKIVLFTTLFLNLNLFGDYLQYSGLSYVSQEADIEIAYPNTLKIEDSLIAFLSNDLRQNKSKNPELSLEVSKTFKDGSYQVIVALDSENIMSIESIIEDQMSCVSTYSLSGQVVVFNAKELQIVSIKPYAINRRYLDKGINCKNINKKTQLLRFAQTFFGLEIPKNQYENFLILDDSQMVKQIKNLYTDSKFIYEKAFIKRISNEILSTNLSSISNTNFFIGIDDVQLGKLALSQMSGEKEFINNNYFLDANNNFKQQAYKVWIGQEFSKWFSESFNLPLIPYVKGKALGLKISDKYEDANELLNLRLPNLDFGFVINIRGFKKVKLDESKLREAYAWAAFSKIEFHNVGIKKITEIDLKYIHTQEVNKNQTFDDWDTFNFSQNKIMKDYVSNIDTFDKKWLKQASKMSSKDFKKHVNYIKKNIRL